MAVEDLCLNGNSLLILLAFKQNTLVPKRFFAQYVGNPHNIFVRISLIMIIRHQLRFLQPHLLMRCSIISHLKLESFKHARLWLRLSIHPIEGERFIQ